MSSVVNEAALAKVHEIVNGIGASNDIEIVDVEVVGGGANRVVRVYIDKQSGVTHADCELVSHQLGELLDAGDVIPGSAYTLEVSSPGVERKLKTVKDFERFTGKRAKVLLRTPVENQRKWEGTLAGVSGNVVTLEASPGKLIQFPLDFVERANLKFQW